MNYEDIRQQEKEELRGTIKKGAGIFVLLLVGVLSTFGEFHAQEQANMLIGVK